MKSIAFRILLACGAVMFSTLTQERRMVMASEASNLNQFEGLNKKELLTTQRKLTHVGPQEKGTPSVEIVVAGIRFDISLFGRVRYRGTDYGNDDVIKPEFCILAESDYRKVYSTILGSLREVREAASRPFFSVTVVQPGAEVVGRAILLDRQQWKKLLSAATSSVPPQNTRRGRRWKECRTKYSEHRN
jgi:hypothetical protein